MDINNRIETINKEISGVREMLFDIENVYIPASVQHQKVFPKYRGIMRGKEIVIVSTGPTARFYIPLKDIVHIGHNNAIYREDIHFDYYVTCDYDGIQALFDKIFSAAKTSKKFFGVAPGGRRGIIIPEYMRNRDDVECFYVYAERVRVNDAEQERRRFYHYFPVDLSTSPMIGYGTSLYCVMQIALWMHPNRIFLVGADSFGSSHYISNDDDKAASVTVDLDYRYFINGWKKLKEFADCNYPDIRIISINPVGLRGIFEDVYTENYLDYIKEYANGNV